MILPVPSSTSAPATLPDVTADDAAVLVGAVIAVTGGGTCRYRCEFPVGPTEETRNRLSVVVGAVDVVVVASVLDIYASR